MSPPDVTPAELSARLADEIEAVVRDLGIDVKHVTRRKLICFAPWSSHHNPKLEVDTYLKPGKWNDWIAGRYGDALGLVGCVLTGQPDQKTADARSEGVKWARERYGLGRSDFDREAFNRRTAEAKKRAEIREATARRELADSRKTVFARWLHAHTLTPGDHGWRYLEARGIDLDAFKVRPRAIRYSAAERWTDSDGTVQHIGPCLLSAMTLPDGTFGSLHRIWVDPHRPGEKADLSPPRKMWPSSDGCAIRLWRGASGLSEKDAAAARISEDVVVCEGVEDGLSIALMAPELRVLAAGSLPGLLSLTPPRSTRKLIVAADNDWDKPQAQALLARACERIERDFKVPVFVARSPEGKDFNDLLKGD